MIEVSIIELNGIYTQLEKMENICKMLRRQVGSIRKAEEV